MTSTSICALPKLLRGVPSPLAGKKAHDINFYVVRKNSEDFYIGLGARMNGRQSHEEMTLRRALYKARFRVDVDLEPGDELAYQLGAMTKEAGVKRFIFASSCRMYGFADDAPRTETSALNPLTGYAKSKVSTEKDLEKIADKKFIVTSLRFATACGMSERLRLDLVLNDFVAGAVASKKITILSDGTPWRPLINIKDMARAIDWAIKRELTDGGEFIAVNTGSNEWNYQVKDLAEAVAKVIPGVDISINKNAQPDKRSYRVSFDLFRKLAPDYQPEIDLISTIEELKSGLEAMNFKDEDFRNSQFIRLKVLALLRNKGLLTEKLEWAKSATIKYKK